MLSREFCLAMSTRSTTILHLKYSAQPYVVYFYIKVFRFYSLFKTGTGLFYFRSLSKTRCSIHDSQFLLTNTVKGFIIIYYFIAIFKTKIVVETNHYCHTCWSRWTSRITQVSFSISNL